MPIIHMHMIEGRTSEQKAAAAKAVTDAVVKSLGVPPKSVRVLFIDMKTDGFYVAGERSGGAAAHKDTSVSALEDASGN